MLAVPHRGTDSPPAEPELPSLSLARSAGTARRWFKAAVLSRSRSRSLRGSSMPRSSDDHGHAGGHGTARLDYTMLSAAGRPSLHPLHLCRNDRFCAIVFLAATLHYSAAAAARIFRRGTRVRCASHKSGQTIGTSKITELRRKMDDFDRAASRLKKEQQKRAESERIRKAQELRKAEEARQKIEAIEEVRATQLQALLHARATYFQNLLPKIACRIVIDCRPDIRNCCCEYTLLLLDT
jgi:hypothetical protein